MLPASRHSYDPWSFAYAFSRKTIQNSSGCLFRAEKGPPLGELPPPPSLQGIYVSMATSIHRPCSHGPGLSGIVRKEIIREGDEESKDGQDRPP